MIRVSSFEHVYEDGKRVVYTAPPNQFFVLALIGLETNENKLDADVTIKRIQSGVLLPIRSEMK